MMLKPKKYRIQLDYKARDFEEIEHLREEMGVGTRADVFRYAISLLRFVVYQPGKQLIVRDPQTKETEVVLLPFFRKGEKYKRA